MDGKVAKLEGKDLSVCRACKRTLIQGSKIP
jgi:hypothetical protein